MNALEIRKVIEIEARILGAALSAAAPALPVIPPPAIVMPRSVNEMDKLKADGYNIVYPMSPDAAPVRNDQSPFLNPKTIEQIPNMRMVFVNEEDYQVMHPNVVINLSTVQKYFPGRDLRPQFNLTLLDHFFGLTEMRLGETNIIVTVDDNRNDMEATYNKERDVYTMIMPGAYLKEHASTAPDFARYMFNGIVFGGDGYFFRGILALWTEKGVITPEEAELLRKRYREENIEFVDRIIARNPAGVTSKIAFDLYFRFHPILIWEDWCDHTAASFQTPWIVRQQIYLQRKSNNVFRSIQTQADKIFP